MIDNPPALGSRAALVEWTWNVHNIVNQSLGKSALSAEDFCNVYNVSVLNGQPMSSLTSQTLGAVASGVFSFFTLFGRL